MDGHERKDMVKYQEIFLEEIKTLLPYFIEFEEDNTILLKNLSDNYTVEDLDQQLIIMITNDKSTFSTNNSCLKVWTFENHGISCPKEKRRDIIVSDFLFS